MAVTSIVTAAAALCLASLALILLQYLALRNALADDLRVQAQIIGNNTSAALMFRDGKAAEETLAGLSGSPSVLAAGIFDASGAVLAQYRRHASMPDLPAPGPALVDAGREYGGDVIDVVQPVHINDQQLGMVMIRAGTEHLYARLATYAALTLGIALASLLLAYGLLASMRRALRRAENELHLLAHVDPVTQLPNRHEFNQRLGAALARADRSGARVALLLLDLDNFKVVNDTLGHDCGDALLKLVAARLADSLRPSDVICRMGGDEFVIILEPAPGLLELDSVARKLIDALGAPFAIGRHELHVSTSIGIGVYPDDARDAPTLIRGADTAMYHAKSLGKNGYGIFEADMELRAQKRMRLEACLRRALERRELELHYQPQFDVRSGRVIGLEALLRWRSPELGPVSPADFIPLAEESGLIVPLGRWVLRAALDQAADWSRRGLLDGVERIAVNLSARQTREANLLADIQAALDASGVPARLLELEITEGVLMDNVRENLELLDRLKAKGIRLSIDDFGTGYSSMSYLKRFPIDQLKIDRSFVNDLPGEGEAIATAIIAMAHSLDLDAVAEGVETVEQLEFLARTGCHVMQGFYFARPMPADDVAALLGQQRDAARAGTLAAI
jgi:diguanylate cyclase (GGDEF)-like protein